MQQIWISQLRLMAGKVHERWLAVVVAALVMVALAAWLATSGMMQGRQIDSIGGMPRATHGTFYSLDISGVPYGKDFELTDMNGQVRHLADFRGKVVAMFFGFTQCPDVCPTTLGEMSLVKRQLGEQGSQLQVLFVTVDPERDTPDVLRAYMQAFDTQFLALVPTPEQLRTRIAPDFKVFYKKVPSSQPGVYTMDHSAGILLFDPQGRLRLHSSYGASSEAIAADVRALLQGK